MYVHDVDTLLQKPEHVDAFMLNGYVLRLVLSHEMGQCIYRTDLTGTACVVFNEDVDNHDVTLRITESVGASPHVFSVNKALAEKLFAALCQKACAATHFLALWKRSKNGVALPS